MVGVEIGWLNWEEVGERVGLATEKRRLERREEMNAVDERKSSAWIVHRSGEYTMRYGKFH